MSVVRILLWNLGDSLASLDELRAKLPRLPAGRHWVSNDAAERFGLVSFGGVPEGALRQARDLIGTDPVVAEEFDLEE